MQSPVFRHFFAILALACLLLGNRSSLGAASITETPRQHDRRMEWFRDARFGMFIHWGVYSIPAGVWDGKVTPGASEWLMNDARIPVTNYEKLPPQFNPVKFNARSWVKLAKAAGMKYIVVTSKHHDGFNMFDSHVSDYSITRDTPFKRDPLKELAAACKAEGITFCVYHSIMDWHHPDAQGIAYPHYDAAPHNPAFTNYVENYLKPEVKQLLTEYGRIGILWFDGEWIGDWTQPMGQDMYDWCRQWQPSVIVNNRVAKNRAGMSGISQGARVVGDYATPEQQIPATGLGQGIDWESCMTMNNSWGYKKDDHNWKSAATIIDNLIDCSSKGGNFLLNVGPTAEGIIPEPSVERLAEVGRWMKVNHDAIYETTASPFPNLSFGKATQKPGKIYLFVQQWPPGRSLLVPLSNKVKRARLVATHEKLVVTPVPEGVRLDVPLTAPDPIVSVIELDIKGEPRLVAN